MEGMIVFVTLFVLLVLGVSTNLIVDGIRETQDETVSNKLVFVLGVIWFVIPITLYFIIDLLINAS